MQVKAARGEIVGEQAQGGVKLAGGGQVVDRLGQGAAEQEGPDAIDRRAGEVRVPAIHNPGGELLARAARARSKLGAERHLGIDRDRLPGLAVRRAVIVRGVADAAQVGVNAAEEGRQAAKVGLLPVLERVIVALGAVDAHAAETRATPAPPAARVWAVPGRGRT